MSLQKTIENEIRYFNSFINQSHDWNFFLGLVDYLQFIKEDHNTGRLIAELENTEKEAKEIIDELSKKSLKELDQCLNLLLGIIIKDNLTDSAIAESIDEYKGLREGRIKSSQPTVMGLNDNLCEIIRFLVQNGYTNEVKDLVELEKDSNGNYYARDFTFSRSSSDYQKSLNIFNDRKETDLWGDWSYLIILLDVILNGEEQLAILKKSDDILGLFGLSHLRNEIEKIKNGTLAYNASNPPFFDKIAYTRRASRIHNFLQKELNKLEETSAPLGGSNSSFQFDSTGIVSGTLNILNYKITFTKKRANILDFFYKAKKAKGNEYQTYKSYNEFIRGRDEPVDSDHFSKRIRLINTKVMKETEGFVKELIEKADKDNNRRLLANRYRLKD